MHERNSKIYNLVNAPLPVPVWSRLCHLAEAHWLTVQTLKNFDIIHNFLKIFL